MDDQTAGAARSSEPVGSLEEEAARLLDAAAAWAGQRQAHAPPGNAADPCPTCGSATEPSACTWCPICQAASFLDSTNPELRAALRDSMVSLAELARTVLDSLDSRQRRGPGPDRTDDQGEGRWD